MDPMGKKEAHRPCCQEPGPSRTYKKKATTTLIGKCCKMITKPVGKIFKSLMRESYPKEAAGRALGQPPFMFGGHGDPAYMNYKIKVNPKKRRWTNGLLTAMKSSEVLGFKWGEGGEEAEISALGDPRELLRKVGRSRRAELVGLQFGQCSSYLFAPVKRPNPPPAAAPPVAQAPNQYNHNYPNQYNYYGYNQYAYGGGGGYDQYLPPYQPALPALPPQPYMPFAPISYS